MNLKDLQYFYDLCQLQSYTEVAKQHKVSQPSISYAIKRLEESFNCKLIHHDPSHRSFKLTNQGQILLKHTELILPEVISTRKEINRSLAHCSTVGFPPIIIQYLFSVLNKETEFDFLKKVRPIRGGSVELLNLLLKGELDASLLGLIEPLNHPSIETHELFHKELYVVLSKNHHLATALSLTFEDLVDQSFILLDEHFVHLKAFELLNQKHQNKAEIFFKSDDIVIIKELLKKGIGVSLLADIALSDEDDDLIKIPLIPEDQITFTVYYAYLKSATLSSEVEALFNLIKSYE
ncbi:LysR family transcriptional regulator [Streptococcus constellatus subsp. pharyngis]|uniref:LysR substrate binding domain protein n=2 Tax=Streptococcus TaxID=1301 RepID=F9P7N3_STRCV|nr:LysR family transcriptional regulator [Streptococcus constellatus]AGU73400.1 putative transcriptional regulator [Streptococcus constellatus subsp. pharyngis C232]AGU75154.1 putative transcriptional regulator [Streptococcus constellatus subsp. pharyngis C818]AGU80545.1 putative transcriptional regulator [Streptococcus constellatus subsp. pharyngis C1050]EGV08598.1 LysR substrate binding domain protein [Streptococcus constellatus subsp. pharyngis SK1060 = CCUG 46377]QQC22674.1 LysR family tra